MNTRIAIAVAIFALIAGGVWYSLKETTSVSNTNLNTPEQGQTIELSLIETAALGMGNIVLLEIVEDSRCPIDVQCITAGSLTARVQYREFGHATAENLELGEDPVLLGIEASTLPSYRMALVAADPEPVSTESIEERAYRLTFKVVEIVE